MIQLTYKYKDPLGFVTWIRENNLDKNQPKASSILIQMYSCKIDANFYKVVNDLVKKNIVHNNLVFVASSTAGEIYNGKTITNETVISVSLFEKTKLVSYNYSLKNTKETKTARNILKDISKQTENIAGGLFISTTGSINTSLILSEISKNGLDFQIFGGGSSDYETFNGALIMSDDIICTVGCILILFISNDLKIKLYDYLGWFPISKEMTITKTEGNMKILEIDNKPAIEVYSDYNDASEDSSFFINTLEYPFLIEGNNGYIAKTPIFTDGKCIQFVTPVKKGDNLRIGSCEPKAVVKGSRIVVDALITFEPEAIYIFTCCCRRYLFEDSANEETEHFQSIAPTIGFYTAGEIITQNKKALLLNSTLVVVGLKE